MKHNKKRNTAFLYRILVTEASKSLVAKDDTLRDKVVAFLKEHFSRNTELGKDLYLYKKVIDNHEIHPRIAIEYISEVNRQREKIDKKKLFDEQTKVIRAINENFGNDIFSNFVDNYRILGTVYQMFNVAPDDVKSIVTLQEATAAQMVSAHEKKKNTLEPIDKITYGIYVKKFNEKYGANLNESQKGLIRKYIYSVSDNGVSFRVALSEEIDRIKTEIETAMGTSFITEDKSMKDKFEKVLEKIEGFKQSKADAKMVKDVMLMQKLVEELSSE